jgi:AcrR family transcriptional regulator
MSIDSVSRGRPRSVRTDAAIRDAVLALVRERGPRAVTMEAVAARAGVAKTTVYRRHSDRSALLRAVLAEAIGEPVEPPHADSRRKLRWALGEAWRQMGEVLGPGGLAAVIADTDPEFTAAFRQALDPYDDALAELIRRDVAAGDLRPGLDAEAAVSLFLGAYLGELVRHGSVGEDWLERCLDVMWVALTGEPPSR